MESGIVYPKDSCAVCGLVYGKSWRPDFRPKSTSDRMIFLVIDSMNEREKTTWESFLALAEKRGFVSKSMCSHAWEVRFRGTEIELSCFDHLIGLLYLSNDIEWVAQFRYALHNPTSTMARTG